MNTPPLGFGFTADGVLHRRQDARPMVLVHLVDEHGLAVCADLIPAEYGAVPWGTLLQQCPGCHLLATRRVESGPRPAPPT